jgi:tungstate transport system substrate-binding protein
MRMQWVLAILTACLLSVGSGSAQERSVTVGVPPGVLTTLVERLSPLFSAETGIAVRIAATGERGRAPSSGPDVLLLPAGAAAKGTNLRVVLHGESVLVGSRADRARVRGLRDIKAAFQWISSARALFVSSSPALGLRERELGIWEQVGVNVRASPSWYIVVAGSEQAVFDQAAQFGAYALIQRATWAAQDDRRGLEIIAEGDPALRISYASELVRADSPEARAWHDWISSEAGQAAVAGWRLNGLQVFDPAADGTGAGTPPRT